MPLTGNRDEDIPELMHRIKRGGTFGNLSRSLGKRKLRKAALAAAYRAEREKRRKGRRSRRS
jgi:hypothetical protein